MIFRQHFSGSSENLYEVIADNGKRLLIDPGCTWKKLQKALNYDLSNIVGALCGHSHADHSKAVKNVLKAVINVYSAPETLEVLGVYEDRNSRSVSENEWYKIDCFDVLPFRVRHDAVNPYGFIIKCGDESMLFATDTACLLQTFKTQFNIVAIEASYNREYLQKRIDYGTIDKSVAQRLLLSHMEEKETMRVLNGKNRDGEYFLDLSKCSVIHLLHMSADNLNKERIKKEFEGKLFREIIINNS